MRDPAVPSTAGGGVYSLGEGGMMRQALRTSAKCGVLAAIVVLAFGACEWVQVGFWVGNGPRTTETFRVSASEWKVSWQLRDLRPDREIRPWVSFRVVDSTGRKVGYVDTYDTWGETYVRAQPGDFYIEIMYSGIFTEWTIIAQDCVSRSGCTGR